MRLGPPRARFRSASQLRSRRFRSQVWPILTHAWQVIEEELDLNTSMPAAASRLGQNNGLEDGLHFDTLGNHFVYEEVAKALRAAGWLTMPSEGWGTVPLRPWPPATRMETDSPENSQPVPKSSEVR